MNQAIQIFPGSEGIKSVYEAALSAKQLGALCTASQYEQVVGNWYDTDYAPRLISSSVATRELLPDTAENRSYAKRKEEGKNQVRFVKGEATETDLVIFGDQAALISFDPANPYAIVFSEEMAKSLKALFERIWQANS